MKLRERTTAILLIVAFIVSMMTFAVSAKPKNGQDFATIQSGEILTSTDEVVQIGFDEYGYNYQAHLFNGLYDDYDRVHGGSYPNVYLVMKWNDAWLSNKDSLTDGDVLLDRHYGFDSYIGSGAWCTNHQFGEYEQDGEMIKWNYFVKIVAVPFDAEKVDGVWYASDGIEIGPDIWGQFAIIQQVENDPGLGVHGLQYISPNCAGLGAYK